MRNHRIFPYRGTAIGAILVGVGGVFFLNSQSTAAVVGGIVSLFYGLVFLAGAHSCYRQMKPYAHRTDLRPTFVLPPWVNYVIAITISSIAGGLLFLVPFSLFSTSISAINWIGGVGLGGFAFFFLLVGGFLDATKEELDEVRRDDGGSDDGSVRGGRKKEGERTREHYRRVPIAHLGVPLIFGVRVGWVALSEGYPWLLPRPIMDFSIESVEEHTSGIPRVEDAAGNPIPPDQREEPLEALNRDGVRGFVEAVVLWRVINPCLFQSVSAKTVIEGMDDLIRNVLRVAIVAKDTDTLRGSFDSLSNTVQAEADKKSREWGIDVLNVVVSKIALQEDVTVSYERKVIEKRERKLEKIEAETVKELIEIYKAMGFTAKEAGDFVQTERGKIRKEVRQIDIGATRAFNNLALAIANMIADRSRS